MSNIISLNKSTPIDEWISISNTGTSVLIDIIGLSGTRLAKRDDEKLLIVWILEKDQSCCGRGAVGFDLCELPWSKLRFDEQKSFMLLVLDGVRHKLGWELLEYSPSEEVVFGFITQIEQLLLKMTISDIDEEAVNEWLAALSDDEPLKQGFPTCTKHNVFLSLFGCHLCNN